MTMTKQEARKILIMEAKSLKRINFSSKDFLTMLKNEDYLKSKSQFDWKIHNAYLEIENELEHVISWVWSPIKS